MPNECHKQLKWASYTRTCIHSTDPHYRWVSRESATDQYLVEGAELERAVLVDGRADVLELAARLHVLQLTHARHVRQPRLDLVHVRDLQACITSELNVTRGLQA